MNRIRALLARPEPGAAAHGGSIAGQAGLVTAGTFVQGLVRFAYVILVGNLLPTGEVSTVGTAISLAMLFALLWPTSAGNAASRFLGAARGERRPDRALAISRYLTRTVIWAALALAACSVPLAHLLSLPPAIMATLPALTLGYAGYIFVRGIQFGSGRAASAAAWDLITSALTVTLLALVLAGRLRPLVLVPLAIGYLTYTAMCFPRLRGASNVPLDTPTRRAVGSFVRWGTISSLAVGAVQQLSVVAARHFDTPLLADQYTAVFSIATPTAMLVGALYQVLFPAIAEAHSAGESEVVRRRVDAATRALAVALLGFLGMIAIAAGPIVAVLYPAKDWAAAPGLAQLLAAGVLAVNVGSPAVIFLSGTRGKGMRTVAVVNVAALTVFAAVILGAGPALGAHGAALGLIAGGLIVSGAPIVIVWRLAGLNWRGLWLRFAVGAALAAALALAVDRWAAGWWSIAIAVGFALAWLALSLPDLRRVAAVSPALRRLVPFLA